MPAQRRSCLRSNHNTGGRAVYTWRHLSAFARHVTFAPSTITCWPSTSTDAAMATPALTPKALLESLHEHLTAQTALLPGLHAQLGLPPVALSAELEQLRAILAQTVEAQITTRQKEVSEWMEKCEDLEKECTKHVKALGIHAKGIPSVGELRKQQVSSFAFRT
jgi:hypothetical protein